MAAAPDFVARTYCPFCQALQPLRFAACPRYTCGDCEGIRDAEVCAVCAKCTFEFCPNCVQVPSVECGGHQAELVEEKTNLRCVECGKQCQEGKDTAHSRCGKCGVRFCLVGGQNSDFF